MRQHVLGARGGAARGVARARRSPRTPAGRGSGSRRRTRIGSSWTIEPQSLLPGMSAADSTATTPGMRADRVEVQRRQAAVRHRRQAERAVQRAGELGHVVDVGRLAGHMQVRRLVRPADADARARLRSACLGVVVDARGGRCAGSRQRRSPGCRAKLGRSACSWRSGRLGVEAMVTTAPRARAASRSRRWSACVGSGDRRRGSRATGAAAGSAPPAGGSRRWRACRTAA